MSIEKITAKILDEATVVKEEILGEAKVKSEAIIEEAKEKASVIFSNMESKGLDEKEKIVQRRKSVAFIDSKKVILNKKQEIIGECFDEAVANFTKQIDPETYVNMLVNMGLESGVKGGKLIFNANEKEKIGKKIVDSLNSKVDKANFALAEETGEMVGGYLIVDNNIHIDNTVESLVLESKEYLSGDVAKMLFEE